MNFDLKRQQVEHQKEDMERNPLYSEKLKNLNTCFASWVDLHMKEEGEVFDFSPVCNEYLNFIRKLGVKYPLEAKKRREDEAAKSVEDIKRVNNNVVNNNVVKNNHLHEKAAAGESSSTLSQPSFSFGLNASTASTPPSNFFAPPSTQPSAPTTRGTFSFGGEASLAGGSSMQFSRGFGGSFSSSCTTSTPSFSRRDNFFPISTSAGSRLSSTASGSIPWSASSPTQSTFGSIPSSGNGGDAANGGGNGQKTEEDEEYEPPQPEAVTVEEEDCLYSKSVRLFYKTQESKQYEKRGKGMMFIKKANAKEDKYQLVIRAENALASIWLNILLNPHLPTSRTDSNVILVCVPNPPILVKGVEDEKETVTYCIKAEAQKDAEEILKKLEEYKR